MKIKISTDSTADIPAHLQESLGISVLPLTIISGDGAQEWLDGVTITTKEFYKVINESSKLPSSAAVSPASYIDLFEQVWQDGYTDIIHTALNSKGSSTYQNGNIAKDQFYELHPEARDNFRIHIVDSLTYSMGYGLAVIEAARNVKAGKSVEEIIEALNDWLAHSRVIFAPLDLKCVKKSGRLSAAAAFVGEALGLKPIITFIDGESKIPSKVRGSHKVMKAMRDICNEERKPGSAYALVLGCNGEANEDFRELVKNEVHDEESEQIPFQIGCVISINSGPNMIGLVYRT